MMKIGKVEDEEKLIVVCTPYVTIDTHNSMVIFLKNISNGLN